MLFLQANQVKKYFGDRLVIAFDRLEIHAGDRIGIVGANGAGKSTLLQLIAGVMLPDEGTVRILTSIGYIPQLDGDQSNDKLSGGERTKQRIADAMRDPPTLLLADEPTANLDWEGTGQLKEQLQRVNALVLISHDRELLDELCTQILEVKDGKLRSFSGGYSAYAAMLAKERARQNIRYEEYLHKKAQLSAASEKRARTAEKLMKPKAGMGSEEARKGKDLVKSHQKKLEKSAKNLRSRVERLERVERPREAPAIRLDLSLTKPPENKIVLSAEAIRLAFGSRTLLSSGQFVLPSGSHTALLGSNGCGKTTLIRYIAEGGGSVRIAPRAVIGCFRQDFTQLDERSSVLDNVMEESVQSEEQARTILARLLLTAADIRKPVGVLSGGERVKTAIAKLLVSPANLLILDEPTNYLDAPSLEALEEVLSTYEGTLLFVSHDRRFVRKVADRLLLFRDGRLMTFEGTWDAYETDGIKPRDQKKREGDRALLQMRLAALAAKIGSCRKEEREVLEAEYHRTVEAMKNI